MIVLENDLTRRTRRRTLDRILTGPPLIAIEHTANATTEHAEVVLPGATFAEGDGTFVNNEGRAQRAFQVFTPTGDITESWRWLRDLAEAPWQTLDDVIDAIAAAEPRLGGVRDAAPRAAARAPSGSKYPRSPHRYSGRTAMRHELHEPKPPDDPDSPLSFSMEGYHGKPPSPLISYFWSPAWNSVQSVNKFQDEVGGKLTGGDPGVRLLEPANGSGEANYYPYEPGFAEGDDARGEGPWLIVPRYDVFGADELSSLAPAVAARTPPATAQIHPDDANTLGVADGDVIDVTAAGAPRRVDRRDR